MQQLAKYDPYAIEQIEFYIKRKTRYTSIKSILVSLIIFVLTIIISYSSFKNIWIKRSQLSIQSSDRKAPYIQMTDAYLCAISKINSVPIENLTIINYSYKTNLTILTYSPTNQYNQIPEIIEMAKGRSFICFNFAGTILNSQYRLKIRTTTEVDLIVKTYSIGQILNIQNSNMYKFVSDTVPTKRNTMLHSKKISSKAYDSLLIDYQPEEIRGISNQILTVITQQPTSLFNQFQFVSQLLKQFQLTQQLIIKRLNIGQILGKFFSWFTILILLFTYTISPIVEYTFKVQLCQNIYDHQKLNQIEISFISFIKYTISKFRKNLFIEQCLFEIFQKLECDLNILNLTRKQNILRRLAQEHQNIQIKAQEEYHQKIQKENEDQGNAFSLLVQNFHSQNNQSNHNQNQDNQIQKQEESEDKYQILQAQTDSAANGVGLVYKIVQNIDIGQTSLSLVANKGQGYKNSYNTIFSTIVLFLVFGFLIFAGVFNFSQDQSLKTLLLGTDSENSNNLVINPQDIIFRGVKGPTDKFILQVKIVNQIYQILENVDIKNGSYCDEYVRNLNEVVGSGWSCLPNSITLFNTGKGSKKSLLVRFSFPTGIAFTNSKIQVTYRQTNLFDSEFIKNIVQVKQTFSSSSLKVSNIQSIIKKSQDQDEYYWTVYQSYPYDDGALKGISFEMMASSQKFEIQKTTIWDVIDTSWGIFILSFSIILSKLTRSLNIRQRQKITQSGQNQNRNDIRAIISTQYALMDKIFDKDLKQIKYFYKQQLNNDDKKLK